MTNSRDWQGEVGRKWAEEWRRTDRSFSGLTDRLLGVASAGRVHRVLDVGCGAGELSLAMGRGHAGAEVVGIDISKPLLDVARERGSHLFNVSFELADSSCWLREAWAPDLIVSRHGVMFYDDPVDAFAHLRAIAAREGRLVFSCFRSREENIWADKIASLLPANAIAPTEPHAPGPFAFADVDYVTDILTAAGWASIAHEAVDFAYVAGTGEDPVADALSYFLAIGPAAAAARDLPDSDKAAFIAKLRRFIENHRHSDMVMMRGAAWIFTARAH
ncbi:MAG: class I SAM-dependent methyltransferase [Sphingomonadales bacterium]|nr:class I SAM-dependent methyltransferase [Sphingomonadales bacterium]MBD3774440.1 class I SAM-dependent methyltransferase [Paracoccaceae bacterium]